ncbi:neutral amino acid uniporter 4-like [Babylonia areolata]|uniref:neutral amino acid uniporter 4-like n=1 Tax=Babylonia areolata TaxID=304850 RepID=UPI003FCF5E2F
MTVSDVRAVMTLLKGNMGTGILAMPYAMYCAGLVVGPLLTFLMGCIALLCMHFLARSARAQRERAKAEGEEDVVMNYSNLTYWALRTYHPALRGWPAKWGRFFVNALLMMSQLGFCSVYIVFIAANIRDFSVDSSWTFVLMGSPDNSDPVRSNYNSNHYDRLLLQAVVVQTSVDFPMWKYQLMVAAPLLIYSQFRGLDKMSPCSAIANILNVIGLSLIFVNIFSSPLPDVSSLPPFAGWSRMPAFFGTIVFSFEGISLVLPVERQVKDKQLYSAPCGVLTLSLTVVVTLYTAMGFFGYLAFGDNTLASITLNLPSSPWYYYSVKPIFAAVMFLSFHLQLFVPVDLVMKWLKDRNGWHGDDCTRTRHKAEALVRLLFFILTVIMSIAVPKLDLLISFIGAVASSFLALILPALIYLLTRLTQPPPHQPPHKALIAFLILIMVVGLLGFVVGTYTSMSDIVKTVS